MQVFRESCTPAFRSPGGANGPRKHDTSAGNQAKRAEKTRHFRHLRRHFFDTVENYDGKMPPSLILSIIMPGTKPNGPRNHDSSAGNQAKRTEKTGHFRMVAQKSHHSTTRICEVAPKDGTPSRNPGDPSQKNSPTPGIWRGSGHHPRYCWRSGAGPEAPPNGPIKHDTFAIRGRTFPIVLRIPTENDTNPR